MTLFVDTEKGRQVAPLLYNAFRTTGILGRVDMPEDRPPAGVETGSRDHLLFLTLAVSLDYQRDAYALWESARRTYEDPATRYPVPLRPGGSARGVLRTGLRGPEEARALEEAQ